MAARMTAMAARVTALESQLAQQASLVRPRQRAQDPKPKAKIVRASRTDPNRPHPKSTLRPRETKPLAQIKRQQVYRRQKSTRSGLIEAGRRAVDGLQVTPDSAHLSLEYTVNGQRSSLSVPIVAEDSEPPDDAQQLFEWAAWADTGLVSRKAIRLLRKLPGSHGPAPSRQEEFKRRLTAWLVRQTEVRCEPLRDEPDSDSDPDSDAESDSDPDPKPDDRNENRRTTLVMFRI